MVVLLGGGGGGGGRERGGVVDPVFLAGLSQVYMWLALWFHGS